MLSLILPANYHKYEVENKQTKISTKDLLKAVNYL